MRSRAQILADIDAIEAELARRTLLRFTQRTMPEFQANWHHAPVAEALDAVLAGRIKRLMVFMPPQNGKSELVSRRFPAYALGRNPSLQVLSCSYNGDLAKEMSRDVQKIIDSRAYRELFPQTRLATAADVGEVRMAAQFDVAGQDGAYRSAGVGGGITGKPMHLGIIDDPVKSRAEAESEAYRKMVWSWYVGDFKTRQTTDQTPIVLVQTRWHEDDLAGRLLRQAAEDPKADQWTVVSFPAVCEQERPGDPRKVGEALWPARFSRTWLEQTRVGAGSYDWAALYQQRPVPAGGAMAQRTWFPIVQARPAAKRRLRCWDLAGTAPTAGRDPDYTVGTLLAELFDGRWLVEHVVRTRLNPAGVDALIKQTALADGSRVPVREWQDPGQAGKSVIAAHTVLLAGWDYAGLPASGEKTLQWRPLLAQAEAGNVLLLQGEWNREWLDEMSTIPYGLHDDQADSVAGAFNALTQWKDYGPTVAAILPGAQTASGPAIGAWREEYFRR